MKCVYIALANPKCKNCCADGASPDAKYMVKLLHVGWGVYGGGGMYMACGMQRVAKMLISFEKRGYQSAAVRLRMCGLYCTREAGVWDTLETKGSLGSETAESEAARVCSGGVGRRTLWHDVIGGCLSNDTLLLRVSNGMLNSAARV